MFYSLCPLQATGILHDRFNAIVVDDAELLAVDL
jgi:hypothetical protein